MKTQFSLAPLALACCLALTGCNGSDNADVNSSVETPSSIVATPQSSEAQLNLLADGLAELTGSDNDISDYFVQAYQQTDEQTPADMAAFVKKFKVLMGDLSGSGEEGLFAGEEGAGELVALLSKGLDSEQSNGKYAKLIQLFDSLCGEGEQGETLSFADILQGFSGNADEQSAQFTEFFANIGGIEDIKLKLMEQFSSALGGQGDSSFDFDAQALLQTILAEYMAKDETGENAEKLAQLTQLFEQFKALQDQQQNNEATEMVAITDLLSSILGEGQQSVLITQLLAALTAASEGSAEIDWQDLTSQILAQLEGNAEFDTAKLTQIIDLISALPIGQDIPSGFDLATLFAGGELDKEQMLNGIMTKLFISQGLNAEMAASTAAMLTDIIIKQINGEEIEFSGEQLLGLLTQFGGAGELPFSEQQLIDLFAQLGLGGDGGITLPDFAEGDLAALFQNGELDQQALMQLLMDSVLNNEELPADPKIATVIAMLEPILAQLQVGEGSQDGSAIPSLQDIFAMFSQQS